MYCKNCGNAIPDGAVVCPNCGCLIEGAKSQKPKWQTFYEKTGTNFVPEKQKEPNKLVGFLVIIVVLIGVILFAILKFKGA